MKRFRILAATLLLIVFGTSAAFADVIFSPIKRASSWVVYVIPVVIIIIAIVLLGKSVKKRRAELAEMEEDDDKLA